MDTQSIKVSIELKVVGAGDPEHSVDTVAPNEMQHGIADVVSFDAGSSRSGPFTIRERSQQ